MKWVSTLFLFGALVLAGSPPPALAAGDTGIYVAPKLTGGLQSLTSMEGRQGGRSEHLESDYVSAPGFGGAVGFDFQSRFGAPARLELEAMHIVTAEGEGTTSHLFSTAGDFAYSQKNTVNSVFVNAYLDWHNDTMFTPYAGVGLGTAWIQSKGAIAGSRTGSRKETNLAWNAALGVATELSYNLGLDVGYRYAGFGRAQTGRTPEGRYLESNLGMHQLILGLRYSF
jgi:opacity protein-like surface antigen